MHVLFADEISTGGWASWVLVASLFALQPAFGTAQDSSHRTSQPLAPLTVQHKAAQRGSSAV